MTESTDIANIERIQEVQRLAEEYASYSASKSGLGNVFGAVAGIVIYLVNGIIGRSIWTTIVTIGLTMLWLVGKEIMRRRVYQPFGEARERWSEKQRSRHLGYVMLITLVTVGIWIWFGLTYIFMHTITPFQLITGLAFATSMPWITQRYLRNEDELMVGVFLLLCCAIVSVGGVLGSQNWEAWAGSSCFALYSLMLLCRSIVEHRQFRQLATQLQLQEGR
jgi:hypothetical protein